MILAGMALLFSHAHAQDYKWQAVPMDGSITGCKAASVDDIDRTIGVVAEDGSYQSPSGRQFPKSSATAQVAAIVLNAQPEMADLKKVIAYSEGEMPRKRSEGALSNWFVGLIMDKVSALSGRKCHVGICNFGGIRKGMPQGDVILDDIQSMFPFRNYLVHLRMKGSSLRGVFEAMAKRRFEALGGVTIEVTGGEITSIMVGDQPLDDEKIYNVATISFLLNGGMPQG